MPDNADPQTSPGADRPEIPVTTLWALWALAILVLIAGAWHAFYPSYPVFDTTFLSYVAAAAVLLLVGHITEFAVGNVSVKLATAVAKVQRAAAEARQTVDRIETDSSVSWLGTGGRFSTTPLPLERTSRGQTRAAASETSTEKPKATVEFESDDPNKYRFGGKPEANGRRLSATVRELPDQHGYCLIRLRVESFDDLKPLLTPVTFFLHPTFKQSVVEVIPRDGVAELTIVAWGAFTVGARTDGGSTSLELDLSTVSDAPMWFRSA